MVRTEIVRERTQQVCATLNVGGQAFPFKLFTRAVQLGDYGSIDYYWMDSSEFRSLRTEEVAANFRASLETLAQPE